MTAHLQKSESKTLFQSKDELQQFVTFSVGGQLFGISALSIQDVFAKLPMTKIPLSPPEIVGTMNLRGRIVTAIDMRTKLGLSLRGEDESYMNIVVNDKGDLYSLVVDQVGEVMALAASGLGPNPASMDEDWRKYSLGVFQVKNCLLVILDVNQFLAGQSLEVAS